MTHPPGWTSRPLGRPAKVIVFGVLATLWACETESVLARAAGHELTVDHVVEMLARENAMPNQADVVDALANDQSRCPPPATVQSTDHQPIYELGPPTRHGNL